MSRDYDPRWRDPERPDSGRGSRAPADPREEHRGDARDVFARDLDLPCGPARERVVHRDRVYTLRASEVRTLATVGAFRVVPASDLRDAADRPAHVRDGDLRSLREQGLVHTVPLVTRGERTTIVTLTREGRALLDDARRPERDEGRQTFYDGARKPRELAHDAQAYRAYEEAAARIASRGGQVRRVVLDYELKRDYQQCRQRPERQRRGDAQDADRAAGDAAAWARAQQLPVDDGHVQFPDVRIEYDDRDGRRQVEDIEIMTPHYRGAQAAAKARAGFTQYRAAGARVGGRRGRGTGGGGARSGGGRRAGRGCDPRLAEELLR
jgi:DNA-binding MarR family transcriptional regulator